MTRRSTLINYAKRHRDMEMMEKVSDLKKKGHTVQQIADELKCHPNTVRNYFKEALKLSFQAIVLNMEDERLLEYDRLEFLWDTCEAAIRGGNLSMIDKALAVMKRKADLMGLDLKTAVSVKATQNNFVMSTEELARLQRIAQDPETRAALEAVASAVSGQKESPTEGAPIIDVEVEEVLDDTTDEES